MKLDEELFEEIYQQTHLKESYFDPEYGYDTYEEADSEAGVAGMEVVYDDVTHKYYTVGDDDFDEDPELEDMIVRRPIKRTKAQTR